MSDVTVSPRNVLSETQYVLLPVVQTIKFCGVGATDTPSQYHPVYDPVLFITGALFLPHTKVSLLVLKNRFFRYVIANH